MKNNIMYYYNIFIKDIINKGSQYYFKVNENFFAFIPIDVNVDQIINIYNYLKRWNLYCHEIIHNKDNSIITNIDNKNYILLKYFPNDNNIDINDIINYQILYQEKNNYDMKDKWCEKIDYYEYQVNQFGKRYPLIRKSFSYYVGICELAISLLNEINEKNIYQVISHNRININDKKTKFYNPINLVIDSRVRDIAEYFKSSFFYSNKVDIYFIMNYVKSMNLNNDECILFFIKMLYPSYYFDIYDDIMKEEISEDKLIPIIEKNSAYEHYLKQIYLELSNTCNMPYIDWFIQR